MKYTVFGNRLIVPLALIGLTSIVAQIVLMRKLLTVFYGNELSVGVALACWLFWVSMGSWTFGRLVTGIAKGNYGRLVTM